MHTASPAASASETAQELLLSAPVEVLNGSGSIQQGKHVASLLEQEKFTNVTAQNDTSSYASSAVIYPEGYEQEAKKIADKLGITEARVSTSYAAITVLVGEDFKDGDAVAQKESKIAGEAQGQTADQVKCQQSFQY